MVNSIYKVLFVLILMLLCVFLLSGCEQLKEQPVPDYELAPKVYECTEAQSSKLQAEAYWCNKNTSWSSAYCYGTAIMRNCTLRQQ